MRLAVLSCTSDFPSTSGQCSIEVINNVIIVSATIVIIMILIIHS